jgi:hypothetical protein
MQQIVNIIACNAYKIPENTELLTPEIPMYLLQTGENTTYEWNGDMTVRLPFTFASPWDSMFQALIDIYGDSLVGKQIIYDPSEPNGNIMRVV